MTAHTTDPWTAPIDPALHVEHGVWDHVEPGTGHIAGTVDVTRFVGQRRKRYTRYYLNIADDGPTFVHGQIDIPANDINPDGTLANCLEKQQ